MFSNMMQKSIKRSVTTLQQNKYNNITVKDLFDTHKESVHMVLGFAIVGFGSLIALFKNDVDRQFAEMKEDNKKQFDELKKLIIENNKNK